MMSFHSFLSFGFWETTRTKPPYDIMSSEDTTARDWRITEIWEKSKKSPPTDATGSDQVLDNQRG